MEPIDEPAQRLLHDLRALAAAAPPAGSPPRPADHFGRVRELSVRMRDHLLGVAATHASKLEELEGLYGRALGRIIAALGGLPLGTRERAISLVRLLAEGAELRAEAVRRLSEGDPELAPLLLATLTTPQLLEQLALRDVPPRPDDGREHAARLVAARAREIIAHLVPDAAREATPTPDEPHLEDVRRVAPIGSSRKR